MLKRLLLSSVLSFVMFILPANAADKTFSLSKQEKQILNALNIPVVMPAYIPSGFTVKKVEAVLEKTGAPGEGSSYEVTFMKKLPNGKNLVFSVFSTAGGVGDVMLDKPVKVRTKLGDAYVYIDAPMLSGEVTLKNCIDMNWLQYKNNFYRFNSGGGCHPEGNDEWLQRISREEALKIIQSLQVVK